MKPQDPVPPMVCDNTVGKLRRWLAMLGYDVVYDARPAREIIQAPAPDKEKRLVLGRCPTLQQNRAHGLIFMHLKSPTLREQIKQVCETFPQDFYQSLLSRCPHCNVLLEGPLPLQEVQAQVPPRSQKWGRRFMRCPVCGQVYWEGTHTVNIHNYLSEVLAKDLALTED